MIRPFSDADHLSSHLQVSLLRVPGGRHPKFGLMADEVSETERSEVRLAWQGALTGSVLAFLNAHLTRKPV